MKPYRVKRGEDYLEFKKSDFDKLKKRLVADEIYVVIVKEEFDNLVSENEALFQDWDSLCRWRERNKNGD